MTQLRTWWRKLGGPMIACLLAALIAGPVLDAVVCKGEFGAAPVSAVFSDGQTDASAPHDQTEPGHGADACVHGHCHHGLTLALAAAEAMAAPAALSQLHAMAVGSPPASLNPSGLERPPRA
jgi:hypothetical protein